MILFSTIDIVKLFSILRIIQQSKKNPSSSSSPKLNLSLNLGFFVSFCFLGVVELLLA
jgi:hypothetical protein